MAPECLRPYCRDAAIERSPRKVGGSGSTQSKMSLMEMAASKGAHARLESLGDLLYLVEQREGEGDKTSQSMVGKQNEEEPQIQCGFSTRRPKPQIACYGLSLLVCPHRRTGGDRRRFTRSILDNKTPFRGTGVSAEARSTRISVRQVGQ